MRPRRKIAWEQYNLGYPRLRGWVAMHFIPATEPSVAGFGSSPYDFYNEPRCRDLGICYKDTSRASQLATELQTSATGTKICVRLAMGTHNSVTKTLPEPAMGGRRPGPRARIFDATTSTRGRSLFPGTARSPGPRPMWSARAPTTAQMATGRPCSPRSFTIPVAMTSAT